MKKSITGAVVLLAGAVVAYSQGQVSFGDYLGSNPNGYVAVTFGGSPVGGTGTHTGTPADVGVGSDWTVELYGASGTGDALSTLAPVDVFGGTTPVMATLAGGGTAAGYVGTWFSTEIGGIPGTVPGTGSATVAVAAWYNNGGTITSITAAQAGGFANGFSATGNIGSLGGAPNLPSTLPALGNIATIGNVGGGGVVTPEPSTIALGVMGASTFLMRLRKKK